MVRSAAALVFCLAVVTTGCSSTSEAAARRDRSALGPEDAYKLIGVGEFFSTDYGDLVVLRVQDEFRLIRNTSSGQIEGYYEIVTRVSQDDIHWNKWLTVAPDADFEIAYVSPVDVAVRRLPPTTAR